MASQATIMEVSASQATVGYVDETLCQLVGDESGNDDGEAFLNKLKAAATNSGTQIVATQEDAIASIDKSKLGKEQLTLMS